jgi:SAM-dependent methyltransferase
VHIVVPGCEFHINDLEPPLPFAKGNDFDLIISLSVFTHIPLEQQIVWLQEMKRVLKPNGFLLCTVVGTSHIDAQLGAITSQAADHRSDRTCLSCRMPDRLQGIFVL